MITPIPLLQSVRVASPCNADWNEMQAVEGDRVHFCMGCGKNVYNLSAMSQAEAEGLLRRHEGRLCVRYYQRRDGTVLTGDCPVGAQAVRMALIRRSAIAAGLFTLMFGAMAGINRAEMKQATAPIGSIAVAPQPIAGQVALPVEEPKPEQVMGKMKMPEPELRATVGIVSRPSYHNGDVIATVPDQPYEYQLYISPKSVEAQSAYSAREAPEKDSTDEAILKSRNEK
jgi:hypothetical protein